MQPYVLSKKELSNLDHYMDHLIVLAEGTKEEIRSILDSSDEGLVRALACCAKVAHASGTLPDHVYHKHARKLMTMAAPRKAIHTKHKVVVGQRGTGFFKDLVKTALPAVGGLLASAIPIPGASVAGGLAGKLVASAI